MAHPETHENCGQSVRMADGHGLNNADIRRPIHLLSAFVGESPAYVSGLFSKQSPTRFLAHPETHENDSTSCGLGLQPRHPNFNFFVGAKAPTHMFVLDSDC
jgi:hypothetical protein